MEKRKRKTIVAIAIYMNVAIFVNMCTYSYIVCIYIPSTLAVLTLIISFVEMLGILFKFFFSPTGTKFGEGKLDNLFEIFRNMLFS